MLKGPFKIGSDPEIFLETKEGKFLNAFDGLVSGIVKGIKVQPEKTAYGAVQVDGMAIELNTLPTTDPVEFSSLIAQGIDDVTKRYQGQVSLDSIKYFDMDWLMSQHPLAIELGCEPDFNAWLDGAVNTMPNMFVPFRTAGGHVHIGWGEQLYGDQHMKDCCAVIKQMDYVLGLWSLCKDVKGGPRRQLYGKAGAFRPKPYGVEYRVLSNFWVFDSLLCQTVVRRAIAGMNALADGVNFAEQYGIVAQLMLQEDSQGAKETTVLIDQALEKYY